MKTKLINSTTSTQLAKGRNLRPLSEYSGVILRLTAKEKKEISELRASIAKLECDLYDLHKNVKTRMPQTKLDYFWNKIIVCEGKIDTLKETIREIMVNRLNIQKAKKKT